MLCPWKMRRLEESGELKRPELAKHWSALYRLHGAGRGVAEIQRATILHDQSQTLECSLKKLIFGFGLLFSVNSFAAENTVKVCAAADKRVSIEVNIASEKLLMTIVSYDSESKTYSTTVASDTVERAIEAETSELETISKKENLSTPLVKGMAYSFVDSANLLIAEDANGLRYLFQINGPDIQNMGTANSCN